MFALAIETAMVLLVLCGLAATRPVGKSTRAWRNRRRQTAAGVARLAPPSLPPAAALRRGQASGAPSAREAGRDRRRRHLVNAPPRSQPDGKNPPAGAGPLPPRTGAAADAETERRREALERTFFHDVLNTASGIQGLLTLMASDDAAPDKAAVRRVLKLSNALIGEIKSHRQLLAGERNELTQKPVTFALDDVLRDLVEIYEKQTVGRDKSIVLDVVAPTAMQTDRTLLSRVVGNLVKNALEATPRHGRIAITARPEDDDVVICVRNDAVLDEATRARLFQSSFSTKGPGRGVGLCSVRLFTERFLGGAVACRSAAGEGTRFEVRVPRVLEPRAWGGIRQEWAATQAGMPFQCGRS